LYSHSWAAFNAIRQAMLLKGSKSTASRFAVLLKNNFSFFFAWLQATDRLRQQRPDLALVFNYLVHNQLSVFVTDWTETQLSQITNELSEEEFMKLWELLSLLRLTYNRCFYFHFHQAARQKFLLRRLGWFVKF
jgi:hypothetical protein